MSTRVVEKARRTGVGEIMQTTGTVLLNARGVNINGYDCFVNLASSVKNYKNVVNFTSWSEASDPLSGFDSYFNRVNSSNTKFSNCSFSMSNKNSVYIVISIPSVQFTVPADFTYSFWKKSVYLISQSQATKPNAHGRELVNSSSVTGSEMYYNTNSKRIQFPNSSGTWIYVDHNKNFADGNWHHFAVTKLSNRLRVFIDGICYYDKTNTWKTHGNLMVEYCSLYKTSYIDDIVYIGNQALWTSNFTPPSTYLLDSEYAIDLSDVRRRNIIAANVDKKLIIPDEPLKQY